MMEIEETAADKFKDPSCSGDKRALAAKSGEGKCLISSQVEGAEQQRQTTNNNNTENGIRARRASELCEPDAVAAAFNNGHGEKRKLENGHSTDSSSANKRVKEQVEAEYEMPSTSRNATVATAADASATVDASVYDADTDIEDFGETSNEPVAANQELVNVKQEPVEEAATASVAAEASSSAADLPPVEVKVKEEPVEESNEAEVASTSRQTVVQPAVTVKKEEATSTTTRSSCRFGIRCYRQNPAHRGAEAHPGDADYKRPNYPPPPADTPDCQYGDRCYRRNPLHFQNFKHPPDTDFEKNWREARTRLQQQRLLQPQPNNSTNTNNNSNSGEEDSDPDPFYDSDDQEGDVNFEPRFYLEDEDDEDEGDEEEEDYSAAANASDADEADYDECDKAEE